MEKKIEGLWNYGIMKIFLRDENKCIELYY